MRDERAPFWMALDTVPGARLKKRSVARQWKFSPETPAHHAPESKGRRQQRREDCIGSKPSPLWCYPITEILLTFDLVSKKKTERMNHERTLCLCRPALGRNTRPKVKEKGEPNFRPTLPVRLR